MGTRADFYIGTGDNAEWLGSIAWDGYPDGHPKALFGARNERRFRVLVSSILAHKDAGGTTPDLGWPWPWNTSATTDFSYHWTPDGLLVACFGEKYDLGDKAWKNGPAVPMPNMEALKRVAGGNRSGLLSLSPRDD